MSLNFCANLSTMFKSLPFHKRLHEAKAMGFNNAEAQFLYEHDLSSISNAQMTSELKFKLINSPSKGTLNHPEESFGFACIPGHEEVFMKSIHQAVEYAIKLDCPKIHVIGGKRLSNHHYADEEYHKTYVKNIKKAAEYLEQHQKLLVIEPMSTPDTYFLKSYDQAVNIMEEISCSNVKLLLDVFHMHRMGMDLEKDILKYLKYAGHVQVSQCPERHEPFYPGEINYEKVFEILKNEYDGDIGLEYSPSDRPDAFDWWKRYADA